MKKILALLLALTLLFSLCACELPDAQDTTPTESTADSTPSESTEPSTEGGGSDSLLPDNWAEFTFRLDGVVYQLPDDYSKFTDNGWTLDSFYSDDYLVPACTSLPVHLFKGEKKVMLRLVNPDEMDLPPAQCKVDGLWLFRDYGNITLELSSNISMNSTVGEIQTAYGDPEYTAYYGDGDDEGEPTGIERFRYETKDGFDHSVSFVFDSEGTVMEINILNYILLDDEIPPTENTPCEHQRTRRETPPTCTNAGQIILECTLCGDVVTEPIAALGHKFSEAACNKAKTCTLCGITEGNALGHSYQNGKCIRCDAEMPNYEDKPTGCDHDYRLTAQTSPTCTQNGSFTYSCAKCDAAYTETTAPNGHHYADASCDSPKTCNVCGDTQGTPLGHSYQDGSCIRCGVHDPSLPTEISYKVTVRSDKGKTIEGVTVQIFTDGISPAASGTTNNKGVFTATILSSDSYTIVLGDIPEGFRAKESYTFSSNMVNINLVTVPIIKPDDHSQANYKTGSSMGDFTVTDTDGNTYELSKLLKEKKLIILDFWYVTCGPCKSEFPYFESIYKTYADDVQLLTFDPFDSEASIKALREEMGVTFPMIKDNIKLHAGFGVEAYPTTVFIDSSGKILKIKSGTYKTEADMISDIERFLK